jgi:hypothetical protein
MGGGGSKSIILAGPAYDVFLSFYIGGSFPVLPGDNDPPEYEPGTTPGYATKFKFCTLANEGM